MHSIRLPSIGIPRPCLKKRDYTTYVCTGECVLRLVSTNSGIQVVYDDAMYVHSSIINRVSSEIPYLAFRDHLLKQPSIERCTVPMIFSLRKRASHWSLAVKRAPVGFEFFDRRHTGVPVLFDVFVAWQWTRRVLWNRSTVWIDADYHWSDQIWACVLRRWSNVITRRSSFLAQAVCFAVTGGCNKKTNIYN